MKWSVVVNITLLGLLSSAFAFTSYQVRAKEKCVFNLECENGGKKFSVLFKSPSGDCTEDDMEVTFSAGGKARDLGLKSDWYFYTDHISKTQPSICKDKKELNAFSAYSVNVDEVLFFIKTTGRPGHDKVLAVLLDSKLGKLMDSKVLGRTRNDSVAVLSSTGGGFKTRIIRDSLSFHKDVTCDCDAPFVDDWMNVSITNGKIDSRWASE